MSSTTFKQELPPPKGYEKIIYQRVPLKAPWPSWRKVLFMTGWTLWGAYLYRWRQQMVTDETLERNAARVALKPLFQAEKDRAMLKNLKALREGEEELMKNVPGWKTGSLYGEPIYKTISPNDWYDISQNEAYILTHPWNFDDVLLHTRYG